MTLLPAAAVGVAPSQGSVNPLGVETTSPAGSVSEKARPVRVTTWLGFVSVKVRVVELWGKMLSSPNALLRFGGLAAIN
jgi:hypothetical protein